MLLTPRPGRLPTRMLFFWRLFPAEDEVEFDGVLVSPVEPRESIKRDKTSNNTKIHVIAIIFLSIWEEFNTSKISKLMFMDLPLYSRLIPMLLKESLPPT